MIVIPTPALLFLSESEIRVTWEKRSGLPSDFPQKDRAVQQF
jgi:hypothetical protein